MLYTVIVDGAEILRTVDKRRASKKAAANCGTVRVYPSIKASFARPGAEPDHMEIDLADAEWEPLADQQPTSDTAAAINGSDETAPAVPPSGTSGDAEKELLQLKAMLQRGIMPQEYRVNFGIGERKTKKLQLTLPESIYNRLVKWAHEHGGISLNAAGGVLLREAMERDDL